VDEGERLGARMSTWAVVGASSFYGKWFCKVLAEHGQLVGRFSLRPPVDQVIASLREARPDYVVNFAALNMVAESWEHWGDYYAVNIMKVGALARGLVGMKGLRRFVQVSTPEVYGAKTMPVLPEDGYAPSTPYAVSRAAADMDLACLWRQHGLPVVFTRAANIYGPEQQPYRIIPRVALACALGTKVTLDGGGKSMRSFLHAWDAAEGIYRAALGGRSGQVYHFATNEMTPIRDLVDVAARFAGKSLAEVAVDGPERPGKDPAYMIEWQSSADELGWEPKIPLLGGVRDTVRWYLERAYQYRGQDLGYHHRP